MKIISKFKDYYDGVAQSKGIDNKIIYVRETKNLFLKDFKYVYNHHLTTSKYFFPFRHGYRNSQEFHTVIIGFCGKLYPLIVKNISYDNNEYIYDNNIIKELCKNHYDSFINMTNDKNILELFYKHKTPVFLLYGNNDNYNFKINPNLKKLEFFKIFDSSSAFQEIEMYISGVIGLNTEKPIEISDKSKIESHGFDYKYSFRKEKNK